MKLGFEAAPTNRSVPAKQASKMLYLLCSLGLVFTAIITSTFIRIVTGKLRMFRIIAVMAKAIFSFRDSCFQTISIMGHITTKNQGSLFGFSYVHGEFSVIESSFRTLAVPFLKPKTVFTRYTYEGHSLGNLYERSNLR